MFKALSIRILAEAGETALELCPRGGRWILTLIINMSKIEPAGGWMVDGIRLHIYNKI
jgi:hypothetical protein